MKETKLDMKAHWLVSPLPVMRQEETESFRFVLPVLSKHLLMDEILESHPY